MKYVKMGLYGEPGVGKSVFALGFPKPFFITTDGNYEFLDTFGANPKDHKQVNSWSEFKKAISDPSIFNGYQTVVVDLLEDLFKWCEYEYCRKNGYDHVSDAGYGKGYDITRNDFFINICKLLSLENKNIILIMHGVDVVTKDRRGVEHTKHVPSSRLPDKLLDMIEGRVRYFLRCYIKADDDGTGHLTKRRYLSLVPKENEYGILRGLNENSIPSDIPLDFKDFANAIGLETDENEQNIKIEKTPTKKVKKETPEKEMVEKNIKAEIIDTPKSKEIIEEKKEVIPSKKEEIKIETKKIEEPIKEVRKDVRKEEIKKEAIDDPIARIKAKLAELQARNK